MKVNRTKNSFFLPPAVFSNKTQQKTNFFFGLEIEEQKRGKFYLKKLHIMFCNITSQKKNIFNPFFFPSLFFYNFFQVICYLKRPLRKVKNNWTEKHPTIEEMRQELWKLKRVLRPIWSIFYEGGGGCSYLCTLVAPKWEGIKEGARGVCKKWHFSFTGVCEYV